METYNPFNQRKIYKVITAIITVITFVIVAIGNDIALAIDVPKQSSEQTVIPSFTLPLSLGTIGETWDGGNFKHNTVIHIQDAHCNYACQKKVAEIIRYCNKKYGVNIVNLEGGEGNYDLSAFTRIKDTLLREKVSDYFLRQGVINGAEYFAVNNYGKVKLWGVEDTSLYLNNLNIYKESLKHKEKIDEHIESLEASLNDIKQEVYSKELLEFDKKCIEYQEKRIELKNYLMYLFRNAVLSTKLKSLYILYQSLILEQTIDFNRAGLERDKLIDALQKTLSKIELKELVLKAVEFKEKNISQNDFYSYLAKKAICIGIDLGQFPELKKYINYISLYETIDKTKTIQELARLEDEIKQELFENDKQRELDRLSKNLFLTKKLFNLTLTRDEYDYYKENKESFKGAMPSAIDNYREDMEKFYEYSFQRDQVFIQNLSPSAFRLRPSAILITGGFHSDNLQRLFRENSISYVSILPNFRNAQKYTSPYLNLLIDNDTMLSTYVTAKASLMAVYSYLCNEGTQKIHKITQDDLRQLANAVASLIAHDTESIVLLNGRLKLIVSEAKPKDDSGKTEQIKGSLINGKPVWAVWNPSQSALTQVPEELTEIKKLEDIKTSKDTNLQDRRATGGYMADIQKSMGGAWFAGPRYMKWVAWWFEPLAVFTFGKIVWMALVYNGHQEWASVFAGLAFMLPHIFRDRSRIKNAVYNKWFAKWLEPLAVFSVLGLFGGIYSYTGNIAVLSIITVYALWLAYVFRGKGVLFSPQVITLSIATAIAGVPLYTLGFCNPITLSALSVLIALHLIINWKCAREIKNVQPVSRNRSCIFGLITGIIFGVILSYNGLRLIGNGFSVKHAFQMPVPVSSVNIPQKEENLFVEMDNAIEGGIKDRVFWEKQFKDYPEDKAVSELVTFERIHRLWESNQLDHLFNALRQKPELLYRFLLEVAEDNRSPLSADYENRQEEFSAYFYHLKDGTRQRTFHEFYVRLRNDLLSLEKVNAGDIKETIMSKSYNLLLEQSNKLETLYAYMTAMLNRMEPVEKGVLPKRIAPLPIMGITTERAANRLCGIFSDEIHKYNEMGYKVTLPLPGSIDIENIAALIAYYDEKWTVGGTVTFYAENKAARLLEWVLGKGYRVNDKEFFKKAMELYINEKNKTVNLFGAIGSIGHYYKTMARAPGLILGGTEARGPISGGEFIRKHHDPMLLVSALDPFARETTDEFGRPMIRWKPVDIDGNDSIPEGERFGYVWGSIDDDLYHGWGIILNSGYVSFIDMGKLRHDQRRMKSIMDLVRFSLLGHFHGVGTTETAKSVLVYKYLKELELDKIAMAITPFGVGKKRGKSEERTKIIFASCGENLFELVKQGQVFLERGTPEIVYNVNLTAKVIEGGRSVCDYYDEVMNKWINTGQPLLEEWEKKDPERFWKTMTAFDQIYNIQNRYIKSRERKILPFESYEVKYALKKGYLSAENFYKYGPLENWLAEFGREIESPNLLQLLSKDWHSHIRKIVASNRYVSREMLTLLLKDKNSDVREAAVDNISEKDNTDWYARAHKEEFEKYSAMSCNEFLEHIFKQNEYIRCKIIRLMIKRHNVDLPLTVMLVFLRDNQLTKYYLQANYLQNYIFDRYGHIGGRVIEMCGCWAEKTAAVPDTILFQLAAKEEIFKKYGKKLSKDIWNNVPITGDPAQDISQFIQTIEEEVKKLEKINQTSEDVDLLNGVLINNACEDFSPHAATLFAPWIREKLGDKWFWIYAVIAAPLVEWLFWGIPLKLGYSSPSAFLVIGAVFTVLHIVNMFGPKIQGEKARFSYFIIPALTVSAYTVLLGIGLRGYVPSPIALAGMPMSAIFFANVLVHAVINFAVYINSKVRKPMVITSVMSGFLTALTFIVFKDVLPYSAGSLLIPAVIIAGIGAIHESGMDGKLFFKIKKSINEESQSVKLEEYNIVSRSHPLNTLCRNDKEGGDDNEVSPIIERRTVCLKKMERPIEQSKEQKIIENMIKTAKDVILQEEKAVHSFVIVSDEAFDSEPEAVSKASLGELEKEIRKIFGHKRKNYVHICKSHEEAKDILEKIDNATWQNTFFYVDSRVKRDGSAATFDKFIKIELKTKDDGSILMAAPISGYTAYSIVYSDLIKKIQNLYSAGETEDVIKREVNFLIEAMVKIKKDMIAAKEIDADIIKDINGFISGVIRLVETGGSENDITEYIKKYQNQHTWILPYIKQVNWQQFSDRFKAEAKFLHSL